MKRGRLLAVLLGGMVFAGAGQASPMCTSNTLAYYETHPCSIGVVNFDLSGAYNFTADDYNPDAGSVLVTPVGTTGLIPGQQVGFTFTDNGFVTTDDEPLGGSPTCCQAGSQANPTGTGWLATNPDNSGNSNFADLNLTFNASIDSTVNPFLLLNSTTTTLTVFIYAPDGGGSYITTGETVINNNTDIPVGGLTINAYGNTDGQSISNGGSALTNTALFSTFTSDVKVHKDILITTTFANTTPNSAALNSLTETFTFAAVPEPGSFVLVGVGALLLAAYRWRKALFGVSAVVAFLAMATPHAGATPLCTSVNYMGNQTMYAYEQLGAGGCMIGNDLFSDFSYTIVSHSGNYHAPSASGGLASNPNPNFSVDPLSGFGEAGFEFQPVVFTNGGAAADGDVTVVVSFDVQVAENLQSPGFATSDTATIGGTGTFAGSNVTLKNGATTLGTITYPNNGSSPMPGNCCSGILAGTTIHITNTFDLTAPHGTSANATHLSDFTDTLNETVGLTVPEPAAALLIGTGLIGLVALTRKRSAGRP